MGKKEEGKGQQQKNDKALQPWLQDHFTGSRQMCQNWSNADISKVQGAEVAPKNEWNKENSKWNLRRSIVI